MTNLESIYTNLEEENTKLTQEKRVKSGAAHVATVAYKCVGPKSVNYLVHESGILS